MYTGQLEDGITNRLCNLDFQEHAGNYRSQDFLQSLKRTKISPSFNRVSDWTDTHQQQLPHRQLSFQLRKSKKLQDEYQKFTLYLSKAQLNSQRALPQPKENVKVAPINVKFTFSPSHYKHRYKDPFKNVESGHTSFYEANYEPLTLLYKIKTNSKSKIESSKKDLPILSHRNNPQNHLPKTERMSSMLRSMKKNQQLRQFRKRFDDLNDAFKLPN